MIFKFVRGFLERIPMPSGLVNASSFKFLLTASMFPSFTASKKEYSSEVHDDGFRIRCLRFLFCSIDFSAWQDLLFISVDYVMNLIYLQAFLYQNPLENSIIKPCLRQKRKGGNLL